MRFPKRTLVLMVLAVVAFAWMYWRTHFGAAQSTPVQAQGIEFLPLEGGDR